MTDPRLALSSQIEITLGNFFLHFDWVRFGCLLNFRVIAALHLGVRQNQDYMIFRSEGDFYHFFPVWIYEPSEEDGDQVVFWKKKEIMSVKRTPFLDIFLPVPFPKVDYF